MRHPKLIEWEDKLKDLFDEVDDYLEDTYGGMYPLHPSRSKRGVTSNKASDGLFNVGASFSAGFGSKYGRGYVIDVHMSTLSRVPDHVKEDIYKAVVDQVRLRLPKYFEERELEVAKDGNVFKIFGDLSLGSL